MQDPPRLSTADREEGANEKLLQYKTWGDRRYPLRMSEKRHLGAQTSIQFTEALTTQY